MTSQTEPTPEMIGQAAHWAAELATDEASEADRKACQAWCREHPLHQVAMDRMRGFDDRLDRADAPERVAINRLVSQRAPRRGAGAVLGLLLLAAAGGVTWQKNWSLRALFPEASTARGELRTMALGDGELRLDTDSAVDLATVDGGSHVALFRGRILARVKPRHDAPFVVETPEGSASALGTAFVVERRGSTTTVAVIESHVRVCPRIGGDCIRLGLGQQVAIDGRRVAALADIEPRTVAAWSDGWFVADDRPVTQLLDELNRYRAVPVRFDAASLKDVRISGSFPLRDSDHALDGVARATGLTLTRNGQIATIARR